MNVCDEAPKNGVGASAAIQEEATWSDLSDLSEVSRKAEAAAVALESCCPPSPSKTKLSGVWETRRATERA